MDEAFVGVDVGTGSVRAGVFTSRGQLLSNTRRVTATWREPGDIVEQSSADIWAATVAAVRAAIAAAGVKPESVAGIGFDATCSLVASTRLDGRFRSGRAAIRPATSSSGWTIAPLTRPSEINRGGHDALRYVGGAISPEMQPPKLLWLARHAPRRLRRAPAISSTCPTSSPIAPPARSRALRLHGRLQMALPRARAALAAGTSSPASGSTRSAGGASPASAPKSSRRARRWGAGSPRTLRPRSACLPASRSAPD